MKILAVYGSHFGQAEKVVRRVVCALEGAALSDRPSAFISVNGSHPESEPEWQAEASGYVAQFVAETGWQPRWTATFTGALRYRSYNPLLRWFMKRIVQKGRGPTDTSQDYEFTDWDHVDRFAAELVAALAGPPQAPVTGSES